MDYVLGLTAPCLTHHSCLDQPNFYYPKAAHRPAFLRLAILNLSNPAGSSTSTDGPNTISLSSTLQFLGRRGSLALTPSQCLASAGNGCHQSPVRECH